MRVLKPETVTFQKFKSNQRYFANRLNFLLLEDVFTSRGVVYIDATLYFDAGGFCNST